MSDGDTVGLLAGSGEETSVPEGLGPCGVLRHVVVGVVREPHDGEVTELVRHGGGAVVQRAGRGHPPGGRVVWDKGVRNDKTQGNVIPAKTTSWFSLLFLSLTKWTDSCTSLQMILSPTVLVSTTR